MECKGQTPHWWAGTMRCDDGCSAPPLWAGRAFVTVALMVFVYPFTCLKNLSALRYNSTAAVMTILFVVLCLVIKLGEDGVAPSSQATTMSPAILLAGPIQGLAFCNQFNILEVKEELPQAKQGSMSTIVHVSMLGVVMPVYALASIAGYLHFGTATTDFGDILDGFRSNDYLMLAAGIAVGLTNVLKFPLISKPFREVINEVIGLKVMAPEPLPPLLTGDETPLTSVLKRYARESQHNGHANGHIEEEVEEEVEEGSHRTKSAALAVQYGDSGALPNMRLIAEEATRASTSRETVVRDLSLLPRAVEMAIVLAIDIACALALHNLALAFQIMGATSGVLVCFVLPAMFALAAERDEWHAEQRVASRRQRGPAPFWTCARVSRIAGPILLLAVGGLVCGAAIVAVVQTATS